MTLNIFKIKLNLDFDAISMAFSSETQRHSSGCTCHQKSPHNSLTILNVLYSFLIKTFGFFMSNVYFWTYRELAQGTIEVKGLKRLLSTIPRGQLTKSATPVTQDGLQTDSTLNFPLLSTTLRANSQQEIKITFMVRSHSPVFSNIFLKMREFITQNLCRFPQNSELQSYRESLCRNSNIKWFYNPDPCTCLPFFFPLFLTGNIDNWLQPVSSSAFIMTKNLRPISCTIPAF